MQNLRIRALGMVELNDDAEYVKLYEPVTDLLFFLAQYAYSPERRPLAVKNALKAVSKIDAQLKGMSDDSISV